MSLHRRGFVSGIVALFTLVISATSSAEQPRAASGTRVSTPVSAQVRATPAPAAVQPTPAPNPRPAPAAVRPSTPSETRQQLQRETQAAMTRPMHVTSEGNDRRSQRHQSAAHARGAFDYRSSDISHDARHAEARAVSRNVRNGTVVVEEVDRPRVGPPVQINTAYRDGQRGNTRVGPDRASATHTHVQPDRVRVAPSTPSRSATPSSPSRSVAPSPRSNARPAR